MGLYGWEDLETDIQNKLAAIEPIWLLKRLLPDSYVKVLELLYRGVGWAGAPNAPGPSKLLLLFEITRTDSVAATTRVGAPTSTKAEPRTAHLDGRATEPLWGFGFVEFGGVQPKPKIPLHFLFIGAPQKLKLMNLERIGTARVAVFDPCFWSAGAHTQEDCDGRCKNHCLLIVAVCRRVLENGV